MSGVTEKSLLEIWSKALPRLPKNRFNTVASFVGILLGVVPVIFGSVGQFRSLLLPYVEFLATIYATLLGFIIAGYAIFTTSANPAFLLAIWKHEDSKAKMPLLKLHLLIYVRLFIAVFVNLFAMMALSAVFRLWPTIAAQITLSDRVSLATQAIVLGIVGLSISVVAVQLKALIFNLYDLTITQVRFLEINEKSEASAKDKK
jgi:hypothetical protein